MEVKTLTVLGAGAMGHGIAEVAALAGLNVNLRDINDDLVQKGYQAIEKDFDRNVKKGRMDEETKKKTLGLITPIVDLEESVKDTDCVIEAVPEILDVKKKVFAEAAKLCPSKTIFATNTSSISVTAISEALDDPSKMGGLHFFNPVPVMPLVEVIYGDHTSEETISALDDLAKKMRKTPIYVRKDVPGFIVNRIFVPMTSEAIWALDKREAQSPLEIDAATKYKMSLPMGLVEIQDTLGGVGCIDVLYHVCEQFVNTLGNSYRAPPSTVKLFKAGQVGKKSGKGFYDWSDPNAAFEIPMSAGKSFDPIRLLAPGVNEAAKLIETGAATKEDIDTGVLLGLNYPRGILRMADDTGIDKIVDELNRLYKAYRREKRYKPSRVLTKLVKDGKLGRKSGEGFYQYGPGKYEFVEFSVDDKKVGRLVLNRPNRANALNMTFLDEISQVLDSVENDKNVGCLVITGKGRNFCGGADMAAFASGVADEMLNFSNKGHDVFTRLETLSKPVIAAINGPAMGGGLEMVLACDLRIMNKEAFVQLPELGLGLLPGWGGTQRLSRLIGMSRTKQMVLLSERVDAEKALEYGLANFVAERDEFTDTVNKTAEQLANGAPFAQKIAKRVMYYGSQADQRTGLFVENAAGGDVGLSEDLSEGITAFMYRRKPNFEGK
ncbi:MAG: 3-hydroxyacyl-CoA dehydrogenase/enoyl-CoA hydratase family protein [Chloroflexota bacterium]